MSQKTGTKKEQKRRAVKTRDEKKTKSKKEKRQ
jgi:hypothetical protein